MGGALAVTGRMNDAVPQRPFKCLDLNESCAGGISVMTGHV